VHRALALLLASALGALLIGCGGSSGVSSGATLSVYLSLPLHGRRAAQGRAACATARSELARSGGRAGPLRIRMTCLDDTAGGASWSLAAVGANARLAAENSATIAYIGELDPAASRFSHPILEAAGIVQIPAARAGPAMLRLLKAIRTSVGAEDLRGAVRDQVYGA
jgi:hypothetical protein